MTWLVFAACVEVAPTGRPFEAVRDATAPAAVGADVAVEAEPAPVEGFDFDAEDRPEDAVADVAPPSAAEAAAALGLAPMPEAGAPSAPVAPPPVAPPPVAPPAVSAPAAFPPPPPGWGVRLVSTVVDAQPPRAILGLPDGKEHVVTPGDLLPEARLVVLAVGRDAVQVAEITPAGDHATVHTYVMGALFPSAGGSPTSPR